MSEIKRNISITLPITMEEKLEFSEGFVDLHTKAYEEILKGNGFGIQETRQAIKIVCDIRHASPVGLKGEYHPMARECTTKHPFSI